MDQKKPYLINTLKLQTPITRIQRFDDNVVIIMKKSFILCSPFSLNRELGGIFHVNYQHSQNIIAVCPVCVRNSYIAKHFYGDGSYIYPPVNEEAKIKKETNTSEYQTNINLHAVKSSDIEKPYLSIRRIQNIVKKRVFTDSNHRPNLSSSSSITQLLNFPNHPSILNEKNIKNVKIETPFHTQKKVRTNVIKHKSFIHNNKNINTDNNNNTNQFNPNIKKELNESEKESLDIFITTVIISYYIFFSTIDFFRMIYYLNQFSLAVFIFFINQIEGNFENSIENDQINYNHNDFVPGDFDENELDNNNDDEINFNTNDTEYNNVNFNLNNDNDLDNDNFQEMTENNNDNFNSFNNENFSNIDKNDNNFRADDNNNNNYDEEPRFFNNSNNNVNDGLDEKEYLDRSNSEMVWLYVDSDNCFSVFSLTSRCNIVSFKFPRVRDIIDICGINNPKCQNGQFAILTKREVLIYEMPLQIEEEEDNNNNDNSNNNEDKMNKYLVFIYQTNITKISPFLNGFLMLRRNVIEYYNDCKISTFYEGESLSSFFVTSPIDKHDKIKHMTLYQNKNAYQSKDEKIIILDRLEKDIILHEITGQKKLGIRKSVLIDVCDKWAVALCVGNYLVISNINDKDQCAKIPLKLSNDKNKKVKQLIAGYNDSTNSIMILLVFSTEIAFYIVSLSMLTGEEASDDDDIDIDIDDNSSHITYFDDENEEEEEEEEEAA
ncbi:hypothetical protein M9Y10_028150 [Tritrichomonas musculus]|uniref:Uncharacterized protein n=1 Tax=Tritrichomonas musculus TaxID=1915356 RepID=A0ABR2KII8_9EUKA